jgi:hypothetical protein
VWELLFWLLEPILAVFGGLWTEDERPGARVVTIGCLGVFLIGVGIVAWLYAR